MPGPGERVKVVVLEADANKKGDLFGRAMQDLFHALGYEDFGLNVHKAGREIDIKGKHRTEMRSMIAECKATRSATGGADLNKFAGVAQAELSRAGDRQITPYFVSLGGFSAPAREQEEEVGHRMVLLDSNHIVELLIQGRVVSGRAEASLVAGTCEELPNRSKLGEKCALLIHEIGWVWSFFFKTAGKYTHFTLVHADGYALHPELANAVIEADAESACMFTNVKYVSPANPGMSQSEKEEAKEAYFEYLEREFGGITLEGLPADQEVGSKTIRLESIYVPLHLAPIPKQDNEAAVQRKNAPIMTAKPGGPRHAVPEIIQSRRHIALLAAPGGGKTTLLKRLAVAYASNDRRGEVADELPAEDWFPLFIRCRQLGSHVRRPITEIIENLPRQAERSDLTEAFTSAAFEALKVGKVLVLVDGLDEISDAGDRSAFAAQLRTFIGTYPTARVIVTSREAGFRAVSGAMASACSMYRIADLSVQDIFTLCRAWEHEVVGGTTEAANKIARSIVSRPRVRDLAINPLLLTTLLLVQRWLGELPPKRSVLYDKAIEVLLMTWNTEGHTPIDQEEAIPQLAYAAFSMMRSRIQTISAKGLKDLFDEARRAMPEVLGYARMPSAELIERVEDRSSLLILSGHVVEDGQLRPLYEFKHLTFQEYLTAKACVESWNPLRDETDDYAEILTPYLDDESWSEVVPLAAVLAGSRGAKRVVDKLIYTLEAAEPSNPTEEDGDIGGAQGILHWNLVQCLADEVQISPAHVRRAIDCVIRRGETGDIEAVSEICASRFSDELPEVAWNGYLLRNNAMMHYANAITAYSLLKMNAPNDIAERAISLLQEENEKTVVEGAAVAMVLLYTLDANEALSDKEDADTSYYPYKLSKKDLPNAGQISRIKDLLLTWLISRESSPAIFPMVMWALAWLGSKGNWQDSEIRTALKRLLEIWRFDDTADSRRLAAWVTWKIPLMSSLHAPVFAGTPDLEEFTQSVPVPGSPSDSIYNRDSMRAAQVIAYYAGLEIPYLQDVPSAKNANPSTREWIEKLSKIRGGISGSDSTATNG